MALIQCPECEGKVSDKATSCPHCGYPINIVPAPRRGRPTKFQPDTNFRLPNGYGTIKTLKGNRRKPYVALVNPRLVLNEQKGSSYYAYDSLGTFSDKLKAYTAILEHYDNPTKLHMNLTVKELYDKWLPHHMEVNSYNDAMRKRYDALFAYCTPLYKIKVLDTTPELLKNVIANASRIGERGHNKGKQINASLNTQGQIKGLLNMLYDYAIYLRILTVNYARTFEIKIDGVQHREGNPYNDSEIEKLWNGSGTLFIDTTLVQIYAGWRPGEVMNLNLDNVDINNWTFLGGSKTDSGKDRLVPIHTNIKSIVEFYYNEAKSIGRPVLFGRKTPYNGSYTYTDNSYRYALLKELEALQITGHIPHDGRHTFSSLGKRYGMDDYARKKIMGHKITDLTDRVYTRLDIEWYRKEIERIK